MARPGAGRGVAMSGRDRPSGVLIASLVAGGALIWALLVAGGIATWGLYPVSVLIALGAVIGRWRGRAWALAAALLLVFMGLAAEPQAQRLIGGSTESWGALLVLFCCFCAYRGVFGLLAGRAAARAIVVPGMIGAVPAPTAGADPQAPLDDSELDRYARHIVLREIGGAGQRKLKAARVLVVGAGGLGAPVILYLAAAGVGRITIADDDTVSVSNLQRQIIHRSQDAGRPKTASAARAVAELNPHVAVTAAPALSDDNIDAIIAGHDLVIDGTDSFAARARVNAACVRAAVPLLAGAIAQWEGQVTLYDPARGAPCMACLFPEAPARGLAPACAEAGVVGALPGVVGAMMALEAIKEITGLATSGAGQGLRGRMVLFDGLWGETRGVTLHRRGTCAVCGNGYLSNREAK